MSSLVAQIAAAASAPIVAHDQQGRELVVKRLTALDRLRLFKALGPVLTQNNAYLGMATLAASVVSVDTVPVPFPVTEAQVEALVGRLGDPGISAVAAVLTASAEPPLEMSAQGN